MQVNGKLRSRFRAEPDADEDTLRQMALSDDRVQKFIVNKPVRNVIVVKKKLVNIVL